MQYDSVLQEFESAILNPFTHREHILIAWLYLRRDGWVEGYPQIQAGIQNFARVHGVESKYHETITCFWSMLVEHCIQENRDIDDFERFIRQYPILLDKSAMTAHYSTDVLKSDVARQTCQEPDLVPMPVR